MFVTLQQVEAATPNLKPYGEGKFAVQPNTQRKMLAVFLSMAHLNLSMGVASTSLPAISITYRKVTKTKPRIAGEDFRKLPGTETIMHVGRVVKVARNREGQVYFTIADANRSGEKQGLTSIRLEGIRSFALVDARMQTELSSHARFVDRARLA